MRITSIDIPKDMGTQNGLEDIKMSRLGEIVLIAGQNGSGKSRLLEKLNAVFSSKPKKTQVERSKKQGEQYSKDIVNLAQYKVRILNEKSFSEKQRKRELESNAQNLLNTEDYLTKIRRITEWNHLETDEESEKYSVLNFVPKNLNLTNPGTRAPDILLSCAKATHKLGVSGLNSNSLEKIQHVQNRWWSANHPNSSLSNEEKLDCETEYEDLKNNIKMFLGVELDRDKDDLATLFGFPLGKAKFSDGQKILLQLCVAIHSQGTQLNELILLMDEPENHMHPGAIIEVLDILKEKMPKGQIWILTHSIAILAHFYDSKNLWFMDKGKISFAGKVPEKVMNSLLGSEEGVQKMHSFLDQPAQLAANRYAYECLCPPEVVMAGPNDPQVGQIKTITEGLYKQYNKIKMLDFGAGKGRLIANLTGGEDGLHEKLSYVALDSSKHDKDACLTAIESVYGTSEKSHYTKYDELLTDHNKSSFQLIVMCNVFHEIHPDHWLEVIRQIYDLLHEDGYLLIVEDQKIPVGEKAYQDGFIVLDTGSLKDLFCITGDEDGVIVDQERNGRLKAHLIKKNLLTCITAESRIAALESCKKQSQREIAKLRTEDPSYSNGQLHSFWIQQFANTSLVLEKLNGAS